MIKEAIVLAGGFGTRLQTVVSDLPKPMAPIGGIPFLVFVLNYLQKFGIEHVILSVGYKSETIYQYFKDNYKSMKISYAAEIEPLGTGGAIKFAMQYANTEEVFVLNGDTLFEVDLFDMQHKHQQSSADITLALRYLKDVERYGSVECDHQNRIISFLEKGIKSGSGSINGGIYLLPINLFEKLSIFTPRFSMEKDIFEIYFNQLQIHGFSYNNYFIDIGIPDDYARAQTELLNKL